MMLHHYGMCPACKQRVFKFGSGQLIEHMLPDGEAMCPNTHVAAWSLEEGLEYIRARQTAAFQHHYNLSLGGGILDRGWSDHDLDIVAVPANGWYATMDNYLDFVLWMNTVNIAKVEEHGWNQTMRKHQYTDERGRKVDWFVVFPNNLK